MISWPGQDCRAVPFRNDGKDIIAIVNQVLALDKKTLAQCAG